MPTPTLTLSLLSCFYAYPPIPGYPRTSNMNRPQLFVDAARARAARLQGVRRREGDPAGTTAALPGLARRVGAGRQNRHPIARARAVFLPQSSPAVDQKVEGGEVRGVTDRAEDVDSEGTTADSIMTPRPRWILERSSTISAMGGMSSSLRRPPRPTAPG